MNANRALWEKGDFTRIAETTRDCGEPLVAGLGIDEGTKRLDFLLVNVMCPQSEEVSR